MSVPSNLIPTKLTDLPYVGSVNPVDLLYVVQSGVSMQAPASAVASGGLVPSGVTAGTYGSSTQVAQITVTDKGLLTSAVDVAIDASAAFGVQTANTILAGPAVAPSANSTFRALVTADIPTTLTGKTLTGAALNGTLGATTPSTAVVTTLTASGQTSLGGAPGSESFRAVVIASANRWVEGWGSNGGRPAINTSAGSLAVRLSGTERAIVNTDSIQAATTTAIPAGGTAGAGFMFSTTANFGVFFGSGVPTLSAAKGSLYLRSDGTTTNDRAYINTNGSTTWTAIITAA